MLQTPLFTSHWFGLNKYYAKRQNGRKTITADKGAHQGQDGACGSGLVGRSEGKAVAMNVLDSLLVPE